MGQAEKRESGYVSREGTSGGIQGTIQKERRKGEMDVERAPRGRCHEQYKEEGKTAMEVEGAPKGGCQGQY